MKNRNLVTIGLSVVAHLAAIGGVGWLAWSLSSREPKADVNHLDRDDKTIAIELPAVSTGMLNEDHEVVPEGTPPTAHGGDTIARTDTGTAGRGGTPAGAQAINLAASNEDLTLSPDLLNRLDRSQHQRLDTSKARTTHEDRRATTNPMELTFLATGTGEHNERRPNSASDPSRGSLASPRAAVLGGHPGVNPDDDEGPGGPNGAMRNGELFASPGVGLREGEAGDHRSTAARIARGRPDVTEGPPTIPAVFNGRPNDTVDSDQEVATALRSLVHESVAGGVRGQGRGGTTGPETDPGAGGQGRGSIARPLGSGDGDVFDWFTNDPALVPYFRKIHAKVDPLWANAFPKSAMLELKQGTVIIEFTVASNGAVSVTWPPARPSGIPEFDKNCADAIRRAGPFDPIPASLGRSTLHIRAPFIAKNPIVK